MSPLTVVIFAIATLMMLVLETHMFVRNGLAWWWGLVNVALIYVMVWLTPWPVWIVVALLGGIVIGTISERAR